MSTIYGSMSGRKIKLSKYSKKNHSGINGCAEKTYLSKYGIDVLGEVVQAKEPV